ncbi:MAG: LysR family transcriptional regulator [Rhodospirillales bacterium]|nr:LysR family transcriptional regulator [Rhodospirillales bacterium]
MKPLRRLPPLNALRSYEAAARHLSFTKAAGELGVTPAAVSHQVKMLEDHIGIPLFQRVNRQLVLTEAGGACLPGIRTAFEGSPPPCSADTSASPTFNSWMTRSTSRAGLGRNVSAAALMPFCSTGVKARSACWMRLPSWAETLLGTSRGFCVT